MNAHFLLFSFLWAVLILVGVLLLNWQSRLRKRGPDDVGDFFFKPDLALLGELSDPANERRIVAPGATNARGRQRRRVEQLRGQLARQTNNVRIGKEWSDTEWHDMIAGRYIYGPDVEHSETWRRWRHDITALREFQALVLTALAIRRSQIWLYCLLWRVLPVPSVARLVKIRGGSAVAWSAQAILWAASVARPGEWKFLSGFSFAAARQAHELDIMELYQQWKAALGVAALAHGEDISEALVSRI
jgi:hypothetical protein